MRYQTQSLHKTLQNERTSAHALSFRPGTFRPIFLLQHARALLSQSRTGFIEKLIRNNFETTLAVSAGIAWTLFKEKTE